MPAATKLPRRILRFQTLDEIADDARRQASCSSPTVGNWSQGEIYEHLARVMDRSLDGFQIRAPLLLRVLGPWFKRRFLRDAVPAGIQLKGRIRDALVPIGSSTEDGLAHLLQAIERLKHEPQRYPHPVLGELTRVEWDQLHLRHAELHLSFIAGVKEVEGS